MRPKRREVFVSYAEYFEDLILFDALGRAFPKLLSNWQDLFFIDVGAYDPIELSVTKAFSDRGGRGINLEPLDDRFHRLVLERHRDINIKAVASDKNGLATLFQAGPASTISPNALKNIRKNRALRGVQEVESIQLNKVLETCLESNQVIHFLKIDVEGSEEAVLRGIDLKRYRPRIILIESVIPWKGTPSYQSWESLVLESEYELGLDFRNNRYYVDKNYPQIKLRHIGNLLKEYQAYLTVGPLDNYRWCYMLVESLFFGREKLRLRTLALFRLLYPWVVRLFPQVIRDN